MTNTERIKKAGIIGAGGAGFPSYAKLSGSTDYLIINGAECEPLLRVDQQLMKTSAHEIISGIKIVSDIIKPEKALIGIKAKHAEAIEALDAEIAKQNLSSKVEIKIIKDAYPAGDEQILVYELTKRIVPEAGIPIMVGCVVLNPETLLNIDSAITKNSPVTEKYLTVTGDVPNPVTLKVPVGMPVKKVFEAAGVTDIEDYSVIDGGPMMGPMLEDMDSFVTKKSKGYVLLKKEHPFVIKKEMTPEKAKRINTAACEQCRMCTDLCPRYLIGHNLNPHKSMRSLGMDLGSAGDFDFTYLCSQCSLCSLFSCPANLYPKDANLYYKEKLMAENVKFVADKSKVYSERTFRDYKLVPTKRLVKRLGLSAYDVHADLTEKEIKPERVGIMIKPHVGAPPNLLVKAGDVVKKGQTLGEMKEDALGADIHSSVDGSVENITDTDIIIRSAK